MHGFYATMGGFAIDVDNAPEQYIDVFGDVKRLSLTAKGVALLAHCGHAPEISVDEIKDKNKADGLAKFLVCVQAGWMIVQVISRSAADLPTTLLEVHTVAHVVCALVMYGIWWHKPRSIEYPTLLRGDWLWPLAAYMYMASRVSGDLPEGALGKVRHPIPKLKALAYIENDAMTAIEREMYQSTYGLDIAQAPKMGYFVQRPGATSDRNQEPSSPLREDEVDSRLKRLAAEAVILYPALRLRFTEPKDQSTYLDRPYFLPYASELVQAHAVDWPNAGLLRRTQSLIMGMILWGASMVYGAIHVAAWDYFFPTEIERLFWHLSSVWVTFCAGFWLLTNLLAHFFPFIDRVWVAYNERRIGWLGTGVITLLCILCGVSYIMSRAYLVIEAFVSIREVPTGVYDTPSWSQVFPHL